jgi:hypothetical protein
VIGACRPGQVSLHARNRSEISYGDVDTVIGEDESGVGGCELGGRHCDVVRLTVSCIQQEIVRDGDRAGRKCGVKIKRGRLRPLSAREDSDKPATRVGAPPVTIRCREPFPAFPNLSAKLHQ